MTALIENKKAYFDYDILESFEAGLELVGSEVKSLRAKRGSLAGSRVIARGNEVYIVGMDIPPYQPKNTSASYDSQRTRKLLLSKKEISRLAGKGEERGLTIIPIRVYTKGRFIKIEIALARGKKTFEKREKIRTRDIEREVGRTLKGR
ncbi:MAG: SsrA-binding protein SmpB [Candidatus Niyogibacteria bacterium]|nr:SsrA-binding protein SmpB [Candidatus Niyogibacteria bacterium]